MVDIWEDVEDVDPDISAVITVPVVDSVVVVAEEEVTEEAEEVAEGMS